MSSDIRNSTSPASHTLRLPNNASAVDLLDGDPNDPNAETATNAITQANKPSTATAAANHAQLSENGTTAVSAKSRSAPVLLNDSDITETKPLSPATTLKGTTTTTLAEPAPPAGAATTTPALAAGAQSFANQLDNVRYEGSDSFAMTAAFMKLDASNLSTNDYMTSFEDQAEHYLRVAAANIANALQNADPNTYFNQASQLQSQAESMLGASLGADGDDAQSVGAQALGSINQDAAWQTLYDNASRDITQAANYGQQAATAKAAGDEQDYENLTAQANDYEDKARQILGNAGIEVSNSDGVSMGKLALQMQAKGDNSNVITAWLGQNPEKAQAFLPTDVYNSVKDQGGQAIVDAIKTQMEQGPLASDDGSSLGMAMAAGDDQAESELLAENPQIAAAGTGALAQVGSLLLQAHNAEMEGYEMEETQRDANQAVDSGTTDQAQWGLINTNKELEGQVLRNLFALTGGSRADQQQRQDATSQANQQRSEVAQLVRDRINLDANVTNRMRDIRS